MALAAYRNIWRAANLAFQGDQRTLNAARAAIRERFEERRSLEVGSSEYNKKVKQANDAAFLLRHNIVQGKADESGKVKLRIRPETELGENESVKPRKA